MLSGNSFSFIIQLILYLFAFSNMLGQDSQEMKAAILASKLEDVYYQGDQEAFKAMFDMEYIFKQILIESEEENIQSFNMGARSQDITFGMWTELYSQIQGGAYYNFVSSSDGGEEIKVLFRLFSSNGLNYHNYIFHKVGEEYLIKDIYLYLTGQYLTESLRNAFASILGSFGNNVDDLEIDFTTLQRLKDVGDLIREGKTYEARKILYDDIEEKYQDARPVLTFKLRATDDVEGEEYQSLVNKLSKLTNARSTIYLLGIDRYFLLENYDEAMRMVDSLGVMTGDDMLDYYRGNIKMAQGEVEEGVEFFKNLKKNFPFLPEAYDALLTIYYNQGKYTDALETLKEVQLNIQISKGEINSFVKNEYPLLYSMDIYQDWLEASETEYELMASSVVESLIGTWSFIKLADKEGNELNLNGNTDEISLLKDGTYEIRHSGETRIGLWEHDPGSDVIFIYVPIDENSADGKSLILNKNYYEDDSGIKYSLVSWDLVFLHNDLMIINLEEDQLMHFRKEGDGTMSGKFEGKVLYSNSMKDKRGEFTTSELEDMVGAYYTYYCKGNKYRTETTGMFRTINVYTGGDTIYTFQANTDTVFYELISDQNEEVIDWELIEEGPVIMGFQTKRFFYQTIKESNEIYFTEAIQVDNPILESQDESWAFFLNMTASIPLKSYMEDPDVQIEGEVIKVVAVDLPQALFEIPKGIRSKLED